MPGLAAVTGATGFIGKALIRALSNNNWKLRTLTRQPRVDVENLQWITGDLQNQQALQQLVQNVDVVIHCAGQVRGNSPEQFLQTNKVGTENLLRAVLLQNKLPRFLLISSLAAREPQLSWYASSKHQAEQVLQEMGEGLQWSVFRPTAVYGPGDQEMAPLFRATKIGLLPMVGSTKSRFGLIYVEDLAQAVVDWTNATNLTNKIYELDDGTSGGYDRYLIKSITSQVWGRPVYIITIPLSLVRWAAGINLGISHIFRYLPMLTPGKVRELVHPDWVCDNHKLIEDTGWQPKVLLPEGLEKTVLQ